MIFEYCEGGDLFDRVVAKSKYTEEEGRLVMKQLLEALRYLHEEACVMHRDITPENIYLPSGEKLDPFPLSQSKFPQHVSVHVFS
jgi:serine/threonine protein kinase